MPHIHEKIDWTVDVLIVHKDTVLIRKHEKYHKWLAVGGHIELDETPDVAALREVKEEVGLDVVLIPPRTIPESSKESSEYQELMPPWYLNIHPITDTHKHMSLIYFATSESDNVRPEYESDRSDEWKWFTEEELEKNEYGIPDSIRWYAQEALKAARNI